MVLQSMNVWGNILLWYEIVKWNTNELHICKGMKMKKEMENEYENEICVHCHLALNTVLQMWNKMEKCMGDSYWSH